MILSSTFNEGDVQVDGRRYVHESHLLDDGRTVDFDYLADDTISPSTVMMARAERLNAEMAAKESAYLIAFAGELPIDKLAWRREFTPSEQKAIDRFNSQFETSPLLTGDQRDAIRTGLENYKVATAINRTHTDTIAMVQLYETLGLLAQGRAAVILNG